MAYEEKKGFDGTNVSKHPRVSPWKLVKGMLADEPTMREVEAYNSLSEDVKSCAQRLYDELENRYR